jgi:hypothetical protein
MAQSRSERNPRTASLPAVSRCARYAVRGLIVAGFAGVAWLLSASVAHASAGAVGSDASVRPPSQQSGLLSPVTSLLIGDGGLLHTGTAGHQAAPHRAGPQPGALSRPGNGGDLVTSAVFTVLSPVTTAAAPVTTRVTQQVTPTQAPVQTVDRAARSTTADASSARHLSTRRPAKAGIVKTHPKRTQEPAVQAVPVRPGSAGDVTTAATGTTLAGVDRTGVAGARAAARLRALSAIGAIGAIAATHEKPVADRTVAQGTHHVPLLPRPAPVPAPPAAGLTSGAPTSGSGLNHDGGAAAALPAAPAGAKVLTFRPDAVEDVELRLLAAEKPTVSPD